MLNIERKEGHSYTNSSFEWQNLYMNPAKNILIVDDEEMIRDVVSSFLETKGFRTFTAATGREALQLFDSQPISFIILDLMLPDISGEEICAIIRQKSRVPVIMLTARTQETEILHGFRIGADDYVTKPFSLKELYARIEAVSRRAGDDLKPLAEKFCWNDGDLEADFSHRLIKKQGSTVPLTPIEWNLLSVFLKYPKKIFTREELISAAFQDDFGSCDRVIDTHIKNLRKKIEDDPRKPVYIQTVHGVGYKFGGEKL